MIRAGLLLGVAAVFVTAAVAAQEDTAQAPPPQADGRYDFSADQVGRGAQAWADNCGRCHNIRSPGELSPDLWNVSVTHMRVRANIPQDVAEDIRAFLMSSSASLTEPESDLSISMNTGFDLSQADITNGQEVYEQTCIACHGDNGEGAFEGMPALSGPNGRLAQADNVLLERMINGFQSEGSFMAMPPMGGNPDLTDQDMADTLIYLRTILDAPAPEEAE